MMTDKFRARIYKCMPKGSDWDCCGTASVVSNIYSTENQMVKRAIPKHGRYRLAVFVSALETYKGIREELIVSNGEIISRTLYEGVPNE